MRNYKKLVVWGSILAAFLTGILFMNLAGDTYLGKNMMSLQKLLETAENKDLQKSGYLYYLIRLRGGSYLILGLLGQAFGGLIWLILYGAWFGLTEGMLLTAGFVQQRLSGIWMMILTQMPHMLLYGLIYATLVKRYMENGNRTDGYAEDRERRRKYFQSWLMNVPVMLTGILAEFYINPWCMKLFYSWIK